MIGVFCSSVISVDSQLDIEVAQIKRERERETKVDDIEEK